jgi:hypothetical protein
MHHLVSAKATSVTVTALSIGSLLPPPFAVAQDSAELT